MPRWPFHNTNLQDRAGVAMIVFSLSLSPSLVLLQICSICRLYRVGISALLRIRTDVSTSLFFYLHLSLLTLVDSKPFFAIITWTQDRGIAALAGACWTITASSSFLASCPLCCCNLWADAMGITDTADVVHYQLAWWRTADWDVPR